MALAAQVFTVLSWLFAVGWFMQAISALRGLPTLPDLTQIAPATLPGLPRTEGPLLTVVVPACNEEGTIEASLKSLLASTGLNLEIIAINDRSTDRTGELLDQIAAESQVSAGAHRLRVLHVSELPHGWLGKPHAMSLGAELAKSPWLLFTDADVIFDPQAIGLSMRYALAQNADHLVLIPTLILKSIGEGAVLSAMAMLAQWSIRLWKVADSRARDFVGSGTFNLIRRETYERLGGFESLRMEVVDDLRLGWMVKRGGFAQRVVFGPGLIRIRWLQGTLGIVHLAEKNAFAVFRFRVGLTLLACLGMAILMVWPLGAIAAGGWASIAGLFTYAGIALTYFVSRRFTQVSTWLAVFFAPATAIVLFAALRSMTLALARKGIDWRGTRYSLEELRRHAGRGW